MKDMVARMVSKLTIHDLRKYAKEYSVPCNEEELNVLYSFLKNHYQDLLDQNIQVFEELRDKIHPALYKQLLNLYIDLKQKYL